MNKTLIAVVMWAACSGGPDETQSPGGTDAETDDTGVDEGPVDADGDGFDERVDCDDADASIYPGADEVCDGVDQDCDDFIDENAVDAVDYFPDEDGDGFGTFDRQKSSCEPLGEGWVEVGGDCDDDEVRTFPAAAEICMDGVDNNCTEGVEDCALSGALTNLNAARLLEVPSQGNLADCLFGPLAASPLPDMMCQGGRELRIYRGSLLSRDLDPVTVRTPVMPVQLQDLNNDGFLDALYSDGTVAWDPQNLPVPYFEGLTAQLSMDANGDGYDDVVGFEEGGAIAVFHGPFDKNTMPGAPDLRVLPAGVLIYAPRRAHDVVGPAGDDLIAWMLVDGSAEPSVLPLAATGDVNLADLPRVRGVANTVDDVTGDGTPEAVSEGIPAYLYSSPLMSSLQDMTPAASLDGEATTLTAGDLTQDGVSDLLGVSGGQVVVFAGPVAGDLRLEDARFTVNPEPLGLDDAAPILVDVDADGAMDLFVSARGNLGGRGRLGLLLLGDGR